MKFSILLPTRNRPRFLRRAVAAILEQDHIDFELIIKDGSDEPVLAELPRDSRITYVHSKDRNVTHARNTASALATGELWHLAADDDVMEPGALTHVANHIGDAMWLYGKVDVVDKDSNDTFEIGGQPFNFDLHLERNLVPTPSLYWHRNLFTQVGSDWREDVNYASDFDLTMRFGAFRTPKVLPTVLARYTLHDAAMSVRCASDRAADMEKCRSLRGLAA